MERAIINSETITECLNNFGDKLGRNIAEDIDDIFVFETASGNEIVADYIDCRGMIHVNNYNVVFVSGEIYICGDFKMTVDVAGVYNSDNHHRNEAEIFSENDSFSKAYLKNGKYYIYFEDGDMYPYRFEVSKDPAEEYDIYSWGWPGAKFGNEAW